MNTPDPRALKALRLSKSAGQWLRCRSKLTGRALAFGIPSATRPGLFHLADTRTCTCPSWVYTGDCDHRLAVVLYIKHANARGLAANAS